MIKVLKDIHVPRFEYFYMFVMVIYMAQMTSETGRMVGSLSGNPIPFLIPIVLSAILVYRNHISFAHRKLYICLGAFAVWSIAIVLKYDMTSTEDISYLFFLFYAIIIAFIHIRVYGKNYFPLYEHIMVVFAAISLVLWLLGFVAGDIFRMFPETNFGNNILYLFNWMDPAKGQIMGPIIRNAGCSWEPGRFAIMLVLAIAVNLGRNGIKLKNNRNAIILLLALATTLSTTGYIIALILYSIYWFKKLNLKTILVYLVVFVPTIYAINSLEFMGEKIDNRIDFQSNSQQRDESFEWNSKTQGEDYVGSLDRFESAYFEWENFLQEPLLGYSRNYEYSWFRNNISKNYALTGGLVKVLSQYGLFMGIIIYLFLINSSIKISYTNRERKKFAIFLTIVLSSISYVIFTIPVFTAFWLYGLFGYKDK